MFFIFSMAPRFELAVGLRKGHKTTKISAGRKGLTDKTIKTRPARLKGVSIFVLLMRGYVLDLRHNSLSLNSYSKTFIMTVLNFHTTPTIVSSVAITTIKKFISTH